jgi:hypothetical protein
MRRRQRGESLLHLVAYYGLFQDLQHVRLVVFGEPLRLNALGVDFAGYEMGSAYEKCVGQQEIQVHNPLRVQWRGL